MFSVKTKHKICNTIPL